MCRTRITLPFLLVTLIVASSLSAEAACRGLDDSAYVAAAVSFYLLHQPNGSIEYLDNGTTVQTLYLPFSDLRDFNAINHDCCHVLGLNDGEGPIYGFWEATLHDLHTTVGIKPMVRKIVGQKTVVVRGSPIRIPLDSCANVVPELMK